MRLVRTFEESRAQMDIYHMDELVTDYNVSPQASTPLTLTVSQIVVSRKPNWKPAQRHISVLAAIEWPVLAEAPRVSIQRISYPTNLIKRRPFMSVQHFLQRDYIGV
jgi:hypothetical protein